MTTDSQSTPSAGVKPGRAASFDVPLMAKALGGLFMAGGTLALLTVLLPHTAQTNEIGLLLIVGDAYLVSAGLIMLARKVPARLLPVALIWGTTLITGVAYFSGGRPSPLIFFYLWIFLYSAYFFTRAQAAVQIAYVGVTYAVKVRSDLLLGLGLSRDIAYGVAVQPDGKIVAGGFSGGDFAVARYRLT